MTINSNTEEHDFDLKSIRFIQKYLNKMKKYPTDIVNRFPHLFTKKLDSNLS
jgi:hypothetical protein